MSSYSFMSLNSSSNNINLVIRKDVKLDLEKLNYYLDFNCNSYAYICHENDINDKGEVEGCHYHIVVIYYSKKRKSTILKEICTLFDFDNSDGIMVDKITSLAGAIQYLTHKRYPFKQQHEYNEIVFKWDEDEFKELYESEIAYTFDYVYKVIKACSSVTDIIRFLGIGYYQRNRATLLDIYNGVQHESTRNN